MTAGIVWPSTRTAGLVVGLVVGKRTAGATHEPVADYHRRTGGRIPWVMTSDEYPACAEAIRASYGQVAVPPPAGRPGRPPNPTAVMPVGRSDATVHNRRANGRAARASPTLASGTRAGLLLALRASAVSRVATAAFAERHHGADRGRCRRKGRKSRELSKVWGVNAAARFRHFAHDFCRPVRAWRGRGADGRWRQRTPAMAAGLTDHVRSMREWLTFPGVQRQ